MVRMTPVRVIIYYGCESMSSAFFAVAFLLLAESCLLLALGFFETGHEAAFLAWLLGVGKHLGADFFLVNCFAENPCLKDGDHKRQEVVVAQAGCVVIEDEEEHHRHQVHHPFHAGHRISAGLVLHVDASVYDVDDCHEQTEQTDVVAVERNRERESQNIVGSR